MRNWSPINCAHGLCLLSMSLDNIISWVRFLNGTEAGDLRIRYPNDLESFDLPWKGLSGVNSASFDVVLPEEHIQAFSAEEILEVYKRTE